MAWVRSGAAALIIGSMRMLAGLLVTLGMIGATGLHAAVPCSVIPLDLSGPRPTVSIGMNGTAPANAIFDTGAMAMSVDSNQASSLKLVNAGPLKAPFNEHGTGYQTRLTRVTVGDLVLGDISVAAMPSMLPGVAAVVGPSTFGNRYVTIDFAASELRVCPRTAANRPAGPGEPYTAPPVVLPAIPIIAGVEHLAAHIDTGSPLGLAFPMSYAKILKLAEPLKRIGVARTHFGEQPIFRARIEGQVRVGALTLDSPQAHFSDVVPSPNVGGELLRRMSITIDPVGKLAWTAINGSGAAPLQR